MRTRDIMGLAFDIAAGLSRKVMFGLVLSDSLR